MDLTFNVTEGVRYKIRKVKIQGTSQLDKDDMLSEIEKANP